MSNCLTDFCSGSRAAGFAGEGRCNTCRGVGMTEFLIALLIFSVGMMSLLSAQLVGKKAVFEAGQRSIATAMVRDILERISANPEQVAAYRVSGIGDEANRLPMPDVDCIVMACSAQQLAAFDLWQWEAMLLGHAEQDTAGYAGGLLTPRACITGSGSTVAVTLSWRSLLIASPPVETSCDINLEEQQQSGEEGQLGELPRRHQLTVSTVLAMP
jgi:type IV pilus assembly protein PilV